MADAALYQHLQGDDAAAVETLRDLLHMSDLLEDPSDKRLVQLLVSVGIRALAMDRLNVITTTMVFTKEADGKGVQFSVAKELIEKLQTRHDPKREVDEFLRAESNLPGLQAPTAEEIERIVQTSKRAEMECYMSAMSLAAHLYQYDNHHWPATADDLRAYLPNLPIDPFGDGKQTIGYVNKKGGLPDGSDRPMVYSRCLAEAGLYFRTDQPFYSFYYNGHHIGDGGQFRDLAAWVPTAKPSNPTTQPLN